MFVVVVYLCLRCTEDAPSSGLKGSSKTSCRLAVVGVVFDCKTLLAFLARSLPVLPSPSPPKNKVPTQNESRWTRVSPRLPVRKQQSRKVEPVMNTVISGFLPATEIAIDVSAASEVAPVKIDETQSGETQQAGDATSHQIFRRRKRPSDGIVRPLTRWSPRGSASDGRTWSTTVFISEQKTWYTCPLSLSLSLDEGLITFSIPGVGFHSQAVFRTVSLPL